MSSDEAESRFALALTQATLDRIPPELRVATAHDEQVMLFLVRVGDAQGATEVLMDCTGKT